MAQSVEASPCIRFVFFRFLFLFPVLKCVLGKADLTWPNENSELLKNK